MAFSSCASTLVRYSKNGSSPTVAMAFISCDGTLVRCYSGHRFDFNMWGFEKYLELPEPYKIINSLREYKEYKLGTNITSWVSEVDLCNIDCIVHQMPISLAISKIWVIVAYVQAGAWRGSYLLTFILSFINYFAWSNETRQVSVLQDFERCISRCVITK